MADIEKGSFGEKGKRIRVGTLWWYAVVALIPGLADTGTREAAAALVERKLEEEETNGKQKED